LQPDILKNNFGIQVTQKIAQKTNLEKTMLKKHTFSDNSLSTMKNDAFKNKN